MKIEMRTGNSALLAIVLLSWMALADAKPSRNGEEALLVVPALTEGVAGPGKRVRVTPPEYVGTDVHYSLYLPANWRRDAHYPVIVEYTGNYYPASGSSGEVQDANLGYGLSAGKFIWVVLPFVSKDGKHNEISWWGDEAATVAYCKRNVPRLCEEYGGDPARVFLCGFSRGAIAVNYIGLYDDEIAKLWRGFITHDHYDGAKEWKGTTWGSPLDFYRQKARERLQRLQGRSVLVMQKGSAEPIRRYLGALTNVADFTFLDVPIDALFPVIPNKYIVHSHTDKWPLFDCECADRARTWLREHAGPDKSGKNKNERELHE